MLAKLGPQAVPDDEHYLWPCNVATWHHWLHLQTQWRTGAAGATGLDYAGVLAYLRECGLRGKKRKEAFECIRAAELATLQAWRDNKSK